MGLVPLLLSRGLGCHRLCSCLIHAYNMEVVCSCFVLKRTLMLWGRGPCSRTEGSPTLWAAGLLQNHKEAVALGKETHCASGAVAQGGPKIRALLQVAQLLLRQQGQAWSHYVG